MFSNADKDLNNKLSWNEFQSFLASKGAEQLGRTVFNSMDVNNDNSVSKEEMY